MFYRSFGLLSLLLAALAWAALAGARSPAADPSAHLLLVPDTAGGEAALARTDARVVARYESFSLVEAVGSDEERLRRAGADRRDDMRTVTTAAGAIDPRSERRSLAGKEAPDRDETLALVQFVGPPKDAWLERLRATGARIVTYQAENAYVVHARGDAVDRLAGLMGADPAVRAVGVLTAADKVEPGGTGQFAVSSVAGSLGAEARAEAAAQAGSVLGAASTVGALRTQYLSLSSAEVAELARAPAVVAIEPYAEPELADERAAQIVAGNLTGSFEPTGPGYLDWLVDPARVPTESTFGFAIDVTDEGLDNGANPPAHLDFREQGLGASRVAYLNNYTGDADARDCGGHGTNVASIAAGYNNGAGAPNEEAAGFNYGMGVAPFARLGASKIFTCAGAFSLGGTVTSLAQAAYAGGARISNNSWGTGGPVWGSYTARARDYDALVRDASAAAGNQELVEVFAAGNDGDDNGGSFNEGYGTILAEGTAKNGITVGAAEGVRPSGTDGCNTTNSSANSARDIVNFSSRGPTDDGRLKPDLVAPGTHITGARPAHAGYTGAGTCTPIFAGTLYSLVSGSSQATPQVSGAAALVRDWYERTEGVPPSAALVKALLINTATDLAGGQNGKGDTIAPGPNTDQGWGRVNVGNALDSTGREYRDQAPADLFSSSGESVVHGYEVADPDKPVRVTLVWTDPPGPSAGDAFVNNLDLEVSAGGRTYKGNVFDGAHSRTGGDADTRNNVESVYLPDDTAGRFAVKVVGTNIPGDGVPGDADSTDQDFALVVSNASEQASPVLVHDATTVDDSVVAGGDGDGAVEPDESFKLDEQLRNAGDADATSVTGTLTSDSPDLTISAAASTSPWPLLAAGATASNGTPFEAELAASATCGADVSATLALTTTEGPHTVPITLATGAEDPGPPVQRTQTNSVSILDDDAAGVTSTIDVPTTGRIKDLDVRISDLAHTWVGDLRIDLTSPDGTTVRLVEHPGGPDNGGNDFVDTMFDDEAPTNIAAADAPYTGRFRPQNDQLARFDGQEQVGLWRLRVRDLFEGDTGTLASWGTDTTLAACDVDSAVPETSITDGPEQGSADNQANPSFSFTSSVGGASFECQLDGSAFAPCTSPKVYLDLEDGTHTFRVRAIDGSKVDPTPAVHMWTIDTVEPETSITSGPASRVSSDEASFQFVSPDTPGATFVCKLDNEAAVACTDPHPVSGLSEGQHTMQVRARDEAENVGDPAIRTWTVDMTAPQPSVLSPEPTTDVTPTLTGTAGTAPGDSNAVAVRVHDGPSSSDPLWEGLSTTAGAGGAWSATVTRKLTSGQPYTVVVEQADETTPANIGTSPELTFEVAPDPSPPETTVSSGPSGLVASREAVFTFSSNEPGSGFECRLDDGAASPCGSPHALVGLSEGAHTFSVQARDPGDNLDPTAATRTWTVDTAAPTPTVLSPAASSTTTNHTPLLGGIAGTASGDEGIVTVKLFRGTLAAGLPAQTLVVPHDGVTGIWSAQAGVLADGTYTVTVEQGDAAGNRGTSAARSFGVTTPPTRRPPPPPGPPAPKQAPGFVVGPVDVSLADALAGRVTALAACASSCEASAKLTVSPEVARGLRLKAAAARVTVGSGRKRLAAAGTAVVRVRLSAAARAAMRSRALVKGQLRVTVKEAAKTLTLARGISVRRSAGLRRIARRGLPLWVGSWESSPLSAILSVSHSEAKRIGLKAKGSGRVEVAAGRTTAGRKPVGLTLKVGSSARAALARARRVSTRLDAVAGTVGGQQRAATMGMTLRR